METQTNKFPHPLVWVATVTFIVFCSVGVAAFMGCVPTPTDKPGDNIARDASKANMAYTKASKASRTAVKCVDCGTIQSVREIDTKGEGSGIGAVVGAVGGAVAGHEIEKHARPVKSYEITVRFDDGSTRVISEANAPVWRAGDKVKVVNGVIRSNA